MTVLRVERHFYCIIMYANPAFLAHAQMEGEEIRPYGLANGVVLFEEERIALPAMPLLLLPIRRFLKTNLKTALLQTNFGARP